jgi:nucleotide-binding universal stress UspA family protein
MAILLLPTDYSAASANAARYAVPLAQKIGAEIHLLHIYQLPVGYGGLGMQPLDATFAPIPMMTIPMEDLKAVAESGMTGFVDALTTEYPSVTFKREIRLGANITNDINEYASSVEPLLVVIGSHDLHGIENWGSHVVSLVKGTHYPVLAVPEDYISAGVSNAVLAADLQPLQPQQALVITNILQQLGASLQVVHVSSDDNKNTSNLQQEIQTLFLSLQPTYTTIVNDDVTAGLQEHLQTASADLLIILPHHHNLWERLFSKEHTSDILSGIHIPILSMPEHK